MITFNLICVGKLKESFLKDGCNEYIKRLSKYIKLNIIEIKEENIFENPNESEINIIKEKEFENIKKYLGFADFLVLYDLKGEEFDSVSYSQFINKLITNYSNITFIIGGSYGISNKINDYKIKKVKFSNLTFPHQLFRLIVLESFYRSFKIINNEKYHK